MVYRIARAHAIKNVDGRKAARPRSKRCRRGKTSGLRKRNTV